MRLLHPVGIIFGVAISLITLWMAARNIEWTQTLNTVRRVSIQELIIGVMFIIAGILLRAERWRAIISKPIARKSVYQAATMGYFFNFIYPARAGDVIKIITLKRSTGQSIGRLGVSGVIDRLLDLLVLLSSATVLLILIPSMDFGKSFFYFVLAGIVFLIYLAFSPVGERVFLSMKRFLSQRCPIDQWATALQKALDDFLTFRSEIIQGSRLIALISVSGLVVLTDYFALSYLLRAFDWHLPTIAPIAVWVLVSAGAALPSAPAGIGINQLACVMALKLFGISQEDAFAFSVILQGCSFTAILLAMLGILGLRTPESVHQS